MRRAEGARRFGAHRIERPLERDAEVCENRAAGAALEQDVLRLEVAVDDALAVRVVQRERKVVQNAPRVFGRETLLRAQSLGERFAVHVLHDDVDEVLRFAERVHGDDVGMAEPCRHPCLTTEPLAMLVRRRELVTQHLDRDQSMEGDVAREKDDPHAAAAELAHDLVLRADVRRDLLALPRHRRRGQLPVEHGKLLRIGVWVDEAYHGKTHQRRFHCSDSARRERVVMARRVPHCRCTDLVGRKLLSEVSAFVKQSASVR